MNEPDIRILKEIANAAQNGTEHWFLTSSSSKRNGYPYDYRYVLCYALRNYVLHERADKDQVANALSELLTAMKTEKIFDKENFFALYPLPNTSFVGVDKAHGCFPLMIKASRGRIGAFERSITDIQASIEQIYKILSRPKNEDIWSAKMQDELESHFHRPFDLGKAA